MWLLDVNLPNGLVALLKRLGHQCDTTIARGWRDLGNGALAEAAYKAGFRVILTRDRLFGESAGKALKAYQELAVVILRIPQSREAAYLTEFERLWKLSPCKPISGVVTIWPT